MVRQIELTRGKVALVDDEDYERLAAHKWYARAKSRYGLTYYAMRRCCNPDIHTTTVRMHRVIMDAPPGMQVDHINGNGLDNRRDNLRLATHSQNQANRRYKAPGKSSQFLGVSWRKREKQWRAQIGINGKLRWLGRFDAEIDAALAYNEAALELHGEFASLNDIDNPGVLINVTEDNHG